MTRLNRHIDLMNNWHRLKRKLRARQPLDDLDYEMLEEAVLNREMNPNTSILISKLRGRVTFSRNDYSCYLNILKDQEGTLYPTLQQIENYKRGYGQFLSTQVVKKENWRELSALDNNTSPVSHFDIDRFFREMCSNLTLFSFLDGITRFEHKFIDPIKQLYRS